jgi:hypothetical protein
VPFIIGLIGIIGAAYFWAQRARGASVVAEDIVGMAGDVMNAARRFGFRRRANVHPVESLEDADVAMAAVGIAFLEMGGLPSVQQQEALIRSLQSHLGQSHEQAQEAVILGRWLVGECGGAQAGFDRLARRLFKMRGHDGFEPLLAVLKDVAAASSTALVVRQSEALSGLATVFRLRG